MPVPMMAPIPSVTRLIGPRTRLRECSPVAAASALSCSIDFVAKIDMLILRTLQWGSQHGYAIGQTIRAQSSDVLQVEAGSLYPALQRLLKEGLVKAEWQVSSTNRRVRTYTLTRAGARHLEREVLSFERMMEGVTRVLAPSES